MFSLAVQFPSPLLILSLPLLVCPAAGCLPTNAHIQRMGQAASTKNSLRKALCILFMDPDTQKSLQDQPSVQAGGGAALPPRGPGSVPNTSHLSLETLE